MYTVPRLRGIRHGSCKQWGKPLRHVALTTIWSGTGLYATKRHSNYHIFHESIDRRFSEPKILPGLFGKIVTILSIRAQFRFCHKVRLFKNSFRPTDRRLRFKRRENVSMLYANYVTNEVVLIIIQKRLSAKAVHQPPRKSKQSRI